MIYQATVATEDNWPAETYVGLYTENSFKTRYSNHKSFRDPNKRLSTELSKHIWHLKDAKIGFSLTWKILKQAAPFNPASNRCNLCLWGKYFIICRADLASLNKRNELVTSRRRSLRSRRLEVAGERVNGRARGRHARVSPRVSPSRAPVFSCARYFQAPATQVSTRVNSFLSSLHLPLFGMFDILFIAESKVDSTISTTLLAQPGFRLVRRDRKKGGGGLLVYIRADLSVYRRAKLEPRDVESICLDVKDVNNNRFLVCGCYRSPSKCNKLEFMSSGVTKLPSIRILGVELVSMLNFMEHISSQLKKAYAKTGALRRVRHFVPMDVILALYKSFILPHLEYCSLLLLGVGKVQANKIDDANHYILRTLTGHGKSLSYEELLNICKLDTLECRK